MARDIDARNFPYGITWIGFIVVLVAALAMISSPDPQRRAYGLLLLLGPLVIFGVMAALFYWRTKRLADEDEP